MTIAATPTDPEIRADGRCPCGKPRKPERSEKYGGVAAQLDPFCSSDCCRRYYNNPVPSATRSGLEDEA